jgi:hypothetical protein
MLHGFSVKLGVPGFDFDMTDPKYGISSEHHASTVPFDSPVTTKANPAAVSTARPMVSVRALRAHTAAWTTASLACLHLV